MKPNKTIREMDSHKLLKAFEIEVNKYGGKRYDCLGNIMPRYSQNRIKMLRTELYEGELCDTLWNAVKSIL